MFRQYDKKNIEPNIMCVKYFLSGIIVQAPKIEKNDEEVSIMAA